MTVESASYISELNASYPADADDIKEGGGPTNAPGSAPGHINMIKSVLKTQFSGLSGTTAVTATEAEMNVLYGIPATLTATELGYVDGVSSAIQTQIDAKGVGDAVLSADQSWTGAQRGTPAAISEGTTIDLGDKNNFIWTPAAADELAFTGEVSGQSGFIKLINPSGYAITKGSEVKASSTFLTDVTTAGTYLITYFVDATPDVWVSASAALS
jgi:hypothetical protein